MQPDGYIVLAGSDGRDTSVLARFDPAGVLDPVFGTNGVVRTRIGGSSEARSVVVQPDGKIVAAGTTWTGMPEPPHSAMALARYLPDGSLDPAFGSDGTVTAAIGSTSASASSLALQASTVVSLGSTRYTCQMATAAADVDNSGGRA